MAQVTAEFLGTDESVSSWARELQEPCIVAARLTQFDPRIVEAALAIPEARWAQVLVVMEMRPATHAPQTSGVSA